MNRRRAIAWALAVALVLAALVAVGRWEAGRRARSQIEGMRGVLTTIGPLDSRSLDAYRVLVNFDCLLYKRGANPFALEICVDPRGRVIEAIDRRSGRPRIWSLRDDPGRSTVRVDRCRVNRLLHDLGVPVHYNVAHRAVDTSKCP